ncbi:MAG: amidohydrolase family protein [Bryobacteraceae bacterium]
MIDVNVSLFRWPFRRFAVDEPAELVASLRKKGVTEAWAGSFEGLLHRDISGVNARLAAACRRDGRGFLVPFGSVNPLIPGWQEDLRRCHENHGMLGIRLHPNYHGYALDAPVVTELLAMAASRGMLVQIAFAMEDVRTQYPLMRVPNVSPGPLVDLARRIPNMRLLVLNATRAITRVPGIAQASNINLDIAMMEGVRGVADLVAATSLSRVVLGSNSPLYYFESASMKVWEAGLSEDSAGAIREGNARKLLPR